MYVYNKKRILILGAGLTGISCINYFISLNIYPKLNDSRNLNKNIVPKGINFFFGYFKKEWILNSDLIVVSPGIDYNHPYILKAKKKNIEIINDIELFFRQIKNQLIICVTGTNGKSTVVSLLFNIFSSYNLNVSLGGNIGIPILNLLNKKSSIYILELSSFQLEYVFSLKSFCSVILNITPDHLDRYKYGFCDYVYSKFKILNNSKYNIVNYNDKKFLLKNFIEVPVITFGINKGDYHINNYNNKKYLSYLNFNYINIEKIHLKGIFNYLNILVCICISNLFKIPKKIIFKNIMIFNGLPHRFNIISKYKGIICINDSKSTNVGSTISALSNLLHIKGKIWLLLGGDSKNVNFKKFLKPYLLLYNNLFICCFGKSKNEIYNLIPNISLKFDYLSDAVKYIFSKVKCNDVILLSPACSSTDQYLNYQERGNEFIYLVNKYK